LLDASYKRFPPDAKVGRMGRIKFGTESNGGFKNITISNCVFEGCHGLALETVDGALLEDVTITNITMRDVRFPFFLRLGSRMRGPAGIPIGILRRVILSNILCSTAASPIGSIISGIPGHEIEDLKLSNIVIETQGGGSEEQAKLQLAENESAYPEPTMFGPTPAYGFFVRHVRGIDMNDVKIVCQKEDARPAFILDDVEKAAFFHIDTTRTGDRPIFVLKDVTGFSVSKSGSVPDTTLEQVKEKEL
jgi:polygalacturonase